MRKALGAAVSRHPVVVPDLGLGGITGIMGGIIDRHPGEEDDVRRLVAVRVGLDSQVGVPNGDDEAGVVGRRVLFEVGEKPGAVTP